MKSGFFIFVLLHRGRSDCSLCLLSADDPVAVGLGLGPLTLALPHDDRRYLRDAWHFSAAGLARPAGASQPDLVHGWSSVVHGGIMAFQAIKDPLEHGPLIGDVPALFAVAIALALLMPRSTTADA